jgi:hypothetical protein
MKNFTKKNIESDWIELINYQPTEEEKAIYNDPRSTPELAEAMKEINKKFYGEPSAEDVEMLDQLYLKLIGPKVTPTGMQMHVTVDGVKKKGVLSFSTENTPMRHIKF